MMQATFEKLANDLEGLMAGRISAEDLRTKYPVEAMGDRGQSIWRGLERFIGDRDRRTGDADYAHMQLSQMRTLIRLLGNDGTAEDFAAITFQDIGCQDNG